MRILSGILLAAVSAVPVAAQDAPLEQPDVERVYTPIPAERLEEMVPKHPGYLGALAPANLNADRAPAPINITGTWFVDLSEGFAHYMFGPPYPRFGPEGVEALIESARAEEEGRRYRNSVGDCYPLGMPMIMTRVWPHAFIQLPTAIYMISGFNNSVRTIFIDGRDFTDPDIVVPSYNGESVGHWEGDTLVVETRYFETDHHWIDSGIPISEEFSIIERFSLSGDDNEVMTVEYVLTDPQMWEGEWRSTKQFTRQDYTDINESQCIYAYNANLPGTELGSEEAEDRGVSEVEGVIE